MSEKDECPAIPTVIELKGKNGEYHSMCFTNETKTERLVYPCICAARAHFAEMLGMASMNIMTDADGKRGIADALIKDFRTLRIRELEPEEFAGEAKSDIDKIMQKSKASH